MEHLIDFDNYKTLFTSSFKSVESKKFFDVLEEFKSSKMLFKEEGYKWFNKQCEKIDQGFVQDMVENIRNELISTTSDYNKFIQNESADSIIRKIIFNIDENLKYLMINNNVVFPITDQVQAKVYLPYKVMRDIFYCFFDQNKISYETSGINHGTIEFGHYSKGKKWERSGLYISTYIGIQIPVRSIPHLDVLNKKVLKFPERVDWLYLPNNKSEKYHGKRKCIFLVKQIKDKFKNKIRDCIYFDN